MRDDVPARLLQSVYRALDDDVDWSDVLDEVVWNFDADNAALGVLETREGQRDCYQGLADFGLDGRNYPRPGSLLGKLSSEQAAGSGLQPSMVIESRRQPDNDMYEVQSGGWLREQAMVLLEMRRQRQFEDGERTQIRRLTEHLARVVRTRQDLQRTRATEQESAAALDVLRVPAAIVDQTCSVMAKNRLFDEIVERNALHVGADNRIHTSRSSLTERLRDNVDQLVEAMRDGMPREVRNDLDIVLEARPQHPTTVVARRVISPDGSEPRVLLSVYHPDADHRIDVDMLEQLYDLTPTEAQTAARLAEGHTVDEIADFRRCAKSTVRTHVKRILQKTGTHRQADLVRVILGSPAAKLTAWGA